MKNIFIIPGYGIPKDILKDEQYKRYLALVFNHIYQICLDKKEKNPLIIFCGGKTDVFKPYKRTEAMEMKKLFLHLARRSFVKDYTKNWQYKLERNSLVTIENLLGAERIAKNIKGKKFIYIFSEKSRERKIKIFAKNIFKKNFKAISIDFDLSSNRYLESEFIRKKEDFSIKYELKALKDKDLYKKFRKIIEDRMIYYRKQGHNKHIESIHQWWKDKLKELEN